MAYGLNVLPKEAIYYEIQDASFNDNKIIFQPGGKATIELDTKRLSSITSNMLVNLHIEESTSLLSDNVYMHLKILMKNENFQNVKVYANHVKDGVMSCPLSLEDGEYKKCIVTLESKINCTMSLYELCPELSEDVTTVIDGVKQSLPRVLYDYNESNIVTDQEEQAIAIITCNLKQNTDVNGHFLITFLSSERCDIYLRFYDNETEELFAPLKYTCNKGHNTIGVPHAYLKRLAGFHNFIVTLQCTNGIITSFVRDILFTIDAGYLAERLINAGIDVQDITCKHLQLTRNPEELWVIGKDASNLLVRKRDFNLSAESSWIPVYSFKGYEYGAIEFYGKWQSIINQKAYTIMTEEEPYIFAIDKEKNLYTWVGNDDKNKILLSTNVDKVHALLGYRSVMYKENDQGLICLYLKEGKAFIRQYEYISNNYNWNTEYIIAQEDTPIIDISLHRLNDYRIGIIYNTSDKNYWLISDRTYVTQAVPIEEHTFNPIWTQSITSMTNSNITRTGKAILFEDKYAPQNKFIIEYELELWLVKEVELKTIITVTVNGVIITEYQIELNKNKIIVLLDTPVKVNKTEMVISIKVNNNNSNLFLHTSNNSHGVSILNGEFTWTIERKINNVITKEVETAELQPTIQTHNIKMTPLNNVITKEVETAELQPTIQTHNIKMTPLNNVITKEVETAELQPTIQTVTLKCIQTGINPI